ncbi:unnamed protein product, partial [Leptidea sinapis]
MYIVLTLTDWEACELDKMANRLLDWFSVMMQEMGGAPPPHDYPKEVQEKRKELRERMLEERKKGNFAIIDYDKLVIKEKTLNNEKRHDERERCLRPFLRWCGAGASAAGVSRSAWCRCLSGATRPCAALARAAARRGGFVPACDARGFYRPRQCHAALAECWCVDLRGQELPGSRTKGAPSCP